MVEEQKQIPIDSEKPIFIKATPPNMMELMKRRIKERTNSINAKHAHNQHPPMYKAEEVSRLPGGGVVVGRLTQDEIRGMKENNDALLRRAMLLREKARRTMRDRVLRGRIYGNHSN